MKNLIVELLLKLAEKEEESKELLIQVEALEVIVIALLQHMPLADKQGLVADIESALGDAIPDPQISSRDTELLHQYLRKLLQDPCR